MSAKITRASLVDAATELNKVLQLSPSIDVTPRVSDLREQIKEASGLLKDTDPLTETTRAVCDALKSGAPDADAGEKTEATKSTKASTKAPRQPATPKLGRFEAVRKGAGLFAKILEATLATDGRQLVSNLVTDLESSEDKILGALKRARVANGIDHAIDDGMLTIVLPKNVTPETVWFKPKEKPVKSGTPGQKVKMTDDQVSAVIKEVLAKSPMKAERLLKELRTGRSGFSCSHERFVPIYQTVVKEHPNLAKTH